MADPLVIHADLELFLVEWYRAALEGRPEQVTSDVVVTNREPSPPNPMPSRLVVIRDDGGPETSILTAERQVGISVLAGTKENPWEAVQLALIVHALRTQIPAVAPGNPVAAVLESNGPYAVPENQPYARRYMTVTFSVTGSPLQ